MPESPVAPLPLASAQREPIRADLSREERVALLDRIDREEVQGCERCGLCRGRTRTVFGEGDPEAEVMFVGEGPGQQEDLQGRPFVGRAGELLDRQIAAMGFERGQVYIANVVKCRPPNNRVPTPDEAEACGDYLARQIEIIRPKAIVTLGGPAAKRLLGTTQGVTRLRGTWARYTGVDPAIPLMPTFHPSYVLRNYTHDTRMKVWNDLKAVCEQIGRPVG